MDLPGTSTSDASPTGEQMLQKMMQLSAITAGNNAVQQYTPPVCAAPPQTMTAASSQYVRLNVGGQLFHTTAETLMSHDCMLRSMFSGRLALTTDADGWVLIDRSGAHFSLILNYMRDSSVALPNDQHQVQMVLQEAKYYCIQGLIAQCEQWLDYAGQMAIVESVNVCRVPIISTAKEERALINASSHPVIKLLINRHNNKYSYTSQSDDNLLKNLELFDKLLTRFDVGAANEVCSWTFFGNRRKVAEVCCTSIMYATDKKHTKVEFPEARIFEEAMNILLFESCRPPRFRGSPAAPSSSSSTAVAQASNSASDHHLVRDTNDSSTSEPSSPTPSERGRIVNEKVVRARRDLNKK